jgi:arylformamidase
MSDNEHRVQFDFEIEFSNGGGLQGQGFRLDIEGDDIADDDLAAYLVRDLGLLMVGDVRIRDKRIIRERHKRRAGAGRAPSAPPDPAGAATSVTRIDLSHTIEHGMITYRGLPAPIVCDFLSREASHAVYAPGTELQIGHISLCSNTGTYVDSPWHRYADMGDLTTLPLDRLADIDAITIDVTGSERRAVDRTHLAPYDVAGKAVLVHTGWDRHWRTDQYFEGHPFLTAEAAAHLVDEGALFVGIDSLNIDSTDGGERPVHSTLLAAEIPICEHMTGLQALPAGGFRFSAVPVKVKGMGSFPVRAYATLAA